MLQLQVVGTDAAASQGGIERDPAIGDPGFVPHVERKSLVGGRIDQADADAGGDLARRHKAANSTACSVQSPSSDCATSAAVANPWLKFFF